MLPLLRHRVAVGVDDRVTDSIELVIPRRGDIGEQLDAAAIKSQRRPDRPGWWGC